MMAFLMLGVSLGSMASAVIALAFSPPHAQVFALISIAAAMLFHAD